MERAGKKRAQTIIVRRASSRTRCPRSPARESLELIPSPRVPPQSRPLERRLNFPYERGEVGARALIDEFIRSEGEIEILQCRYDVTKDAATT